jgi:LAO/AO transport system kinase
LEIGHELDPDAPMPPIVMTRGDNGEGVEELKETISEHRRFLYKSGRIKERHVSSIKEFILSWATNKMEKEMHERLTEEDTELMEKVRKRELDPISAAETLYRAV